MSIWTSGTRRTGGGVGVWAFRPVGPGLEGGGGGGVWASGTRWTLGGEL